MAHYLVTWEIEVDASDPTDAAAQAQEIQRDENSLATVFVVEDQDVGEAHEIDVGKRVLCRFCEKMISSSSNSTYVYKGDYVCEDCWNCRLRTTG